MEKQLEEYQKSTLEDFVKELEGFSDEEEISLDSKPVFATRTINPFVLRWESVRTTGATSEMQKDSSIISFPQCYNFPTKTKVGELKKILAPIVSVRPDLIVCIDERIKIGPLKRGAITANYVSQSQDVDLWCAKSQIKSFIQSLCNLKLSDPTIIHPIIKSKYPNIERGEIFIVGDQIFTHDMLLEKYPHLTKQWNVEYKFFSESKKIESIRYFSCIIPPSAMEAEFGTIKSEFERVLEKYKNVTI